MVKNHKFYSLSLVTASSGAAQSFHSGTAVPSQIRTHLLVHSWRSAVAIPNIFMALRLNIPPVTRILLLLLVILSFLYNYARFRQLGDTPSQPAAAPAPVVPYLTLVPAVCLFYPWTFLTATFVEQNILNLFIDGTAIFLGGKYLERAWGSKDFAIVVLIATAVPHLLIVPPYIVWFGHELDISPVLQAPARSIWIKHWWSRT